MNVSEILNILLTSFGPWTVVCFILYWFTQNTENTITKLTDAINSMNVLINNMNVTLEILMDNVGVNDNDNHD